MKNWLRYIDCEMGLVEGWLDPIDAKLIGTVADCQSSLRIRGGAVEIGVHHGKLFLLLAHLLSAGEHCLAIDLFEDQSRNVDRSGRGDWEKFTSNFQRLFGEMSGLRVLRKSSLDTRLNEILSLVGPVRLFSVDGGHTAKCTLNDMLLASGSLTDGGLVVLDDYFNPHWPDVSVGTGQFFIHQDCHIVPFAIGRNKVLFTTPNYAAHYRAALQESFGDLLIRQSRMSGAEVDIYGVNHTIPSMIDTIKLQLKRTKIGRQINQAMRGRRFRNTP
jgi:hypothetical protein